MGATLATVQSPKWQSQHIHGYSVSVCRGSRGWGWGVWWTRPPLDSQATCSWLRVKEAAFNPRLIQLGAAQTVADKRGSVLKSLCLFAVLRPTSFICAVTLDRPGHLPGSCFSWRGQIQSWGWCEEAGLKCLSAHVKKKKKQAWLRSVWLDQISRYLAFLCKSSDWLLGHNLPIDQWKQFPSLGLKLHWSATWLNLTQLSGLFGTKKIGCFIWINPKNWVVCIFFLNSF